MNQTVRRTGYAETAQYAADASLRGRTLAIPFEDVWQAAVRLAHGGMAGWSLTSADDYDGIIHAVCRSVFGKEHDIVIRITLDTDAQTRVDAQAAARKPGTDFGAAARRVRRFFRALDAALSRSSARTRSAVGAGRAERSA